MRSAVLVTSCTSIFIFTLLACGDNRVAPPPPEPDATALCSTLELGTPVLRFNLFNQLTGVSYPITAGEAAGAVLVVELYDESTGGLPPLATGTFDLATPPDDSIATCQHCTFVERPLEDGSVEVAFYQRRGAMQLVDVSDPLAPVFAGDLTGVELRETTVDDAGQIAFVPDGACRRIERLAFDTTPVDAPCEALVDCPNELLQVCDPQTQRCVAPQCNIELGGCTGTQSCVPQLPTEFTGACYDICDPSAAASSCAAGFTCVQTGPRPDLGFCLRAGAGVLDTACAVKDASSSCVDGLACSAISETCTAPCDLFADPPGCSAGQSCSLFGRCEPPAAADPAAFGEVCAADAELAGPCAADALGFQGYCFAFRFEDPLQCVEACLDESDCRTDQFCSARFTSGLGTCLADPVCGDGMLGEVGEVCDDGNTSDGDTCSANCQRVDYPASCATAESVAAGSQLAGDTRTALDGFQSSCQGARARTELYRFAPGTPGRLTLTLTSPTLHAVSVLDRCDESPLERACGIVQPGFGEPIVTQLVTADPVTIGVAAFNVIEEGPFDLAVDFVPELCGDGIVAGNEVCDDGNTASADGCRGDCLLIEYDVVCATATPLSLEAPNTGDTSGAPFLFENSCSAEVTGRDRVYTFTAPAAGTLSLRLDQGGADLALVVFRGCGAPATLTELACSSVLGVEDAAVELAPGELVTIVIDGFDATAAGPYSLTATFQ